MTLCLVPYSIVNAYLHEKQINNLNYIIYNYLIRYNYIEIYHFIIEIIFNLIYISESTYNKLNKNQISK